MKTRRNADLPLGPNRRTNPMVMKKITFNADAGQLKLARRIAEDKGTTFEEEVRQWLKDFGEGRWKLPPQEPKTRKGRKSAK